MTLCNRVCRASEYSFLITYLKRRVSVTQKGSSSVELSEQQQEFEGCELSQAFGKPFFIDLV